MKKKITLITSILLILALAVTFVGCNKDKTEETPTTEASEKVSTTEPTTKFEAPEIKDEPTTEETSETTTKKPTYSSNSGSSSGSSNSGSNSSNNNSKPSSKPVSTTKAPTVTKAPATTKAPASNGGVSYAGKNENGYDSYTNQYGGGFYIEDPNANTGGHGSADDFVQEGWGTGGTLS